MGISVPWKMEAHTITRTHLPIIYRYADQAVQLQQLQPNIQINFNTHLHNQLNITVELWKFDGKYLRALFPALSLSALFERCKIGALHFWLIFRYLWRNICDPMPKGNWKSNRTFISSSSFFFSLLWPVSTLIQGFCWLFWLSKRVHRMLKCTMKLPRLAINMIMAR